MIYRKRGSIRETGYFESHPGAVLLTRNRISHVSHYHREKFNPRFELRKKFATRLKVMRNASIFNREQDCSSEDYQMVLPMDTRFQAYSSTLIASFNSTKLILTHLIATILYRYNTIQYNSILCSSAFLRINSGKCGNLPKGERPKQDALRIYQALREKKKYEPNPINSTHIARPNPRKGKSRWVRPAGLVSSKNYDAGTSGGGAPRRITYLTRTMYKTPLRVHGRQLGGLLCMYAR